MALLCIPVSELVSFAFSTIPICPFLIQRIFHLLVYISVRYNYVGFLYISIKYGETALHVASGAGQSAVVTSLLDHGADVHAVTEVGDCIVLLLHDNIICTCMYIGYQKTSFHTYFMPLYI